MGVLSSELSSWRKHLVECKAGIVNTLNFRDTRPNVMLVMNPSDAKIMCCLDSIPTEKNYDFMIKNHYARLVGRPTPTSQIYFLSDYDVTLQVYSIYDKNFDPSWLSDFSIDNVNLESESLQPLLDALKAQSKTEIAGVKEGVILPTHDSDIHTQLATFFKANSFSQLLSSHELDHTINLKSILRCLTNNHTKLTSNNKITLESINNNINSLRGVNSVTLSDVLTAINILNTTMQDCKSLLTDIKTNTTPTTTP